MEESKITVEVPDVSYLRKLFGAENCSLNDMWLVIDNLYADVEHLKEKLEDTEKYYQENYIPRKRSDYTGDKYDDLF